MTTHARAALAACLFAAAVLALYTGAALSLTSGYVAAFVCLGAGVALLFRTPEDHQ